MTRTCQKTPFDVERERRNLGAALVRLTRVLSRNADSGRSLGIAIGERTLSVNPERCVLASGRGSQDKELTELTQRVLAWQVKALSDLDRSRSQSGRASETEIACRGGLIFDAASGILLEEQLNRFMEERDAALSARWLEQLRPMRYSLATRRREIAELLGPSAFEEIEEAVDLLRSWDLFEMAPPEPKERRDSAKAGTTTARSPRTRGRRQRKTVRIVTALSIVLVVALSLHVAMNLSSWLDRPPEGILEIEDFAGLPAVLEIEDRPPSVFLTVNADIWSHLDERERAEVLDRTQAIIRKHGYQGALFYTEGGEVVAQWATHSGNVFFGE